MIIVLLITCMKQVMRNAIAHHLLTDAQPNAEQSGHPPPASHPCILFSMTSNGMELPLWLVWVTCPGSVPSQLLLHPQP